MGKFDGDIILKSPDKEFLRLRGSDGAILVEGRVAANDPEVVDTFRRWLSTVNVSKTKDGDMIFMSGMGMAAGTDGSGKNLVLSG